MQFVHSYDKKYVYGEEGQARPCQFAFAKFKPRLKVVEVLHYPVLCRDFLSDTLAWKSGQVKSTVKVYGYKYRGYVDPRKVCLYFRDTWPTTLTPNVSFLRNLEEEIGLKIKTAVHADELSNEALITADKWWMSTTVHFSFYTYLLRQLSEERPVNTWADFQLGELGQKLPEGVIPKLHLMLKKLNVTDVSGTAPDYRKNAYVVHDYNGFKSQFSRPEWTVYGEQLIGLSKT